MRLLLAALTAASLLGLATLDRAPGPGGVTRPAGPQSGAPVATVGGPAATAPAVGSYRAPVVPLRVLRAFVAPATPYGPGHRGVDLAATAPGTAPGATPVRAAAGGVVRFAGPVAGRSLVVVVHADGVSTEYEPLDPRVRAGQHVAAGTVLGLAAGAHGRCAPGRCLHWAARRGGRYIDPLALLRPLGRVHLLPSGVLPPAAAPAQ